VLVFNHAEIDLADWEEARQSATAIFRNAGVGIEWRSFSPAMGASPPQADRVSLPLNLILPGQNAYAWMKKTFGLPKTALGFALTQPRGAAHGDTAYVFLNLVEELVQGERSARLGVILGHIVAHELGHLLLGQGHAPSGLMSAEIGKLALRLAGANKLHFTRVEARKLRDAMVERTSRR
jgi:hypothetical protein